MGALSGPILGLFLLGFFFPRVNNRVNFDLFSSIYYEIEYFI